MQIIGVRQKYLRPYQGVQIISIKTSYLKLYLSVKDYY